MSEAAVAALRAGRAVILPTDTVYGLCALPEHEDVLYGLKGRDRSKPVALLAADVDALLDAVPGLDRAALERYLPGAYTLVVGTVGVRVPNLPPRCGRGRPRGRRRRRDERQPLGRPGSAASRGRAGGDPRRCGAIVDAGELPGVPSTVIDLTGAEPRVLRQGAGLLPE